MLLTRESPAHPWRVELGDFDDDVVLDEKIEYMSSGVQARNLKIITTSSRQGDIDLAVLQLNVLNQRITLS